jgi:16S rRNA (cytosine967-C5)-methyltransferase
MSAGAAARAAAARAVGAVIGPGRSLDDALAAATGALQGPDRALAAQLAYGSLRLYPRLARWTSLLLARPLPPRDADVQALLAIGLYQIEASRVPDHAAVDASVEAARLLGRARHAGLVNACLRRWLREGDALKARVAREPEVIHAHPRWWLDALAHDWPRDWEALVAANNAQAPMWVRVNHRRNSREAWLARAVEAGIDAVPWDPAPDALRLEKPVPVEELPGFAQGDVSVQDGAAQLAAGLLAPEPGMRVLDACAAPGGKACHLLERYDDIELSALDVAPARLGRVRDNLARLGLEADVVQGDAAVPAGWWDGRPY